MKKGFLFVIVFSALMLWLGLYGDVYAYDTSVEEDYIDTISPLDQNMTAQEFYNYIISYGDTTWYNVSEIENSTFFTFTDGYTWGLAFDLTYTDLYESSGQYTLNQGNNVFYIYMLNARYIWRYHV